MPDSPVLILDPELAETAQAAGRNVPELEVIPSQDQGTLQAAAARAAAVVTQGTRVDAPLLAQAHALRLLSKDLIAAHRDAVQGAYRRLGLQPVKTSQRVIAFRWMQPARLHEVRGKTLGCVGFGEIGCELSLRAQPLGMRVIYTRRRPLPARLEDYYAVTHLRWSL